MDLSLVYLFAIVAPFLVLFAAVLVVVFLLDWLMVRAIARIVLKK